MHRAEFGFAVSAIMTMPHFALILSGPVTSATVAMVTKIPFQSPVLTYFPDTCGY